jgi:hypothetical protein
MRKKILDIVLRVASKQLRWCTSRLDKPQKALEPDDFYEFADQILSLLREEIKKVENPHDHFKAKLDIGTVTILPSGDCRYEGFEDCRQKILKKMEEK